LCSGDILLIDDHVDLMGNVGRALLPVPAERTGKSAHPTFYDPRLLSLAECIATEEHIPLRRGTYVAMLGPNYETRAEYRWLRTLGDVVGMSTVPEVLVAQELGLPAIAFSMVANVFRPDDVQQTTSEDVVHAAASAEPKLRQLVTRLLTSDPDL
jgi:purine-nucleoside phosphorylase